MLGTTPRLGCTDCRFVQALCIRILQTMPTALHASRWDSITKEDRCSLIPQREGFVEPFTPVSSNWSGLLESELPVAQNPEETGGCHMRSRWQPSQSHTIIQCAEKLRVQIDLLRAGGIRNFNIILIGMPEGRRQLGRPRHKWDDNVKMGLR
jgi:hypothetical protein